MTLAPGAKLGPYEIVAPLGAGGMGEVWRARDTRLGREVAIKVLPAHLAFDPNALARFEREARAVAALSHPNILAIHDFGADSGTPYVAMELIEGGTLRERLAGGALPVRKAVEIATQIARGLAAAHEKGIVHRDLKPENVLVTADGQVKILDFGLARQDLPATGPEDTQTPTLAGVTMPGAVLGTAGYMAPEQVRGEAADARADIFSLGAVLYEMLYGRRAFQRDTAAETMTAILHEDPPAPPADSRVPPAVDHVVRGCLEKAPGERFRSAHDLAFALEMAVGSTSSQAVAGALAARPRRRRRLWLAVGTMILIAYAIGTLFGTGARRPRPLFFRQLTSQRGSVISARFSPDGHTVVYGAAWVGHPLELFSTRTDGFESRSLGLPSGDVLSIARTGDMLLLSGRRNLQSWMAVGTLARASLSGGAQREVLENVSAGELSPDGSKTAIVHRVRGLDRLECPPGNPLYQTLGWIGTPRFSSAGDRIALIEHPLLGDDRGHIVVVDLRGRTQWVGSEFTSLQGLAWTPSGREVWFTATSDSDAYFTLYAAGTSGPARVVLSAPVELEIQDLSPRGAALLCANHSSGEIAGRFPGQPSDRLVDFFAESATGGLSADGRTLAVTYAGVGSGSDYSVWILRTDGSPAVRLGDGGARSLSPDGKWVVATFASAPSRMVLLPTGAAEARTFDLGTVSPVVNTGTPITWTRDGSAFLFTGRTTASGPRSYLFDLAKGKARPVTPENTTDGLIAPDGSAVLARGGDGAFALWKPDGSAPRRPPGIKPDDIPLQWEASGRAVFVWNGSFPARVERLELDTGRRSLWKEISAPDPSGVLYGNLLLTPDGQSYVYRYRRLLSNLFVVDGVR
jgi:hypothetical protein